MTAERVANEKLQDGKEPELPSVFKSNETGVFAVTPPELLSDN